MKKYIKASEANDYYDFDERIFAKLPGAVKSQLNDAWDRSKDNTWFSPYLTALVDCGIITTKEKLDILKSNVSYGYDSDVRASTSSRKKIQASTLLEKFMKYHESARNYHSQPDAFEKMYKILDSYGSSNEDVDVLFKRAPRDEQELMVEMITPEWER